MKYCYNCGEQIDEKAVICVHCGVQQSTLKSSSSISIDVGEKSRTTAGLLAILFGGIGVHKFYLGDMGTGLVYLFFSWTFIPLIIGFIEGIGYFSMTDEEFAAKYS